MTKMLKYPETVYKAINILIDKAFESWDVPVVNLIATDSDAVEGHVTILCSGGKGIILPKDQARELLRMLQKMLD